VLDQAILLPPGGEAAGLRAARFWSSDGRAEADIGQAGHQALRAWAARSRSITTDVVGAKLAASGLTEPALSRRGDKGVGEWSSCTCASTVTATASARTANGTESAVRATSRRGDQLERLHILNRADRDDSAIGPRMKRLATAYVDELERRIDDLAAREEGLDPTRIWTQPDH